jgi:hypothetical protein
MRPVKRVMRLAFRLALLSAPVAAQQPPDFSGRWQLVPDRTATTSSARSVPAMGSGWGSDLSIAQDATTLSVEFTPYVRYDMQPPTRLVYRLDGAESTNTVNVGRGPQDQVSTAAWDGARLTITTVRTFSAAPGDTPTTIRTTQIVALESPTTLVVETTHAGALGGAPSTSRSIYKKN